MYLKKYIRLLGTSLYKWRYRNILMQTWQKLTSKLSVIDIIFKYSRLSLSRLCLSCSANLVLVLTWNSINWQQNIAERRNCSYGASSLLFHNIFNISVTSRVKLHSFVKCGCSIYMYLFLNSANLICQVWIFRYLEVYQREMYYISVALSTIINIFTLNIQALFPEQTM